jgi:hypothetical protein
LEPPAHLFKQPGLDMSFLVQGRLDDHALSATAATAKDAFAKAIEWQERFTNVTISDGTKTYSIEAFAVAKGLLEIAKAINASAETGGG